MIIANGHEYRTLADRIEVDGRRVRKVLVDGVRVYPDYGMAPDAAMWFAFAQAYISAYSDEPVNQYGAYVRQNGEVPIYRVAYIVLNEGRFPRRMVYVSYDGFVTSRKTATFIPYVARDGVIVADGSNSSSINTFGIGKHGVTSNGRHYYSMSRYIGANLRDADGNYLGTYVIGVDQSPDVTVIEIDSSDEKSYAERQAIAFVTTTY